MCFDGHFLSVAQADCGWGKLTVYRVRATGYRVTRDTGNVRACPCAEEEDTMSQTQFITDNQQ